MRERERGVEKHLAQQLDARELQAGSQPARHQVVGGDDPRGGQPPLLDEGLQLGQVHLLVAHGEGVVEAPRLAVPVLPPGRLPSCGPIME